VRPGAPSGLAVLELEGDVGDLKSQIGYGPVKSNGALRGRLARAHDHISGGTFVMNSPSFTSCASTMPSSDCAARPFSSQTNRVPFAALTSTSASFERSAASFFPLRAIALKSTELARRIISRHASNSKPYDRARSRLTYPRRTRAPRRPARSARRYQSELYEVAAWDFSMFFRYRAMSAGPGKKTYASAFESAAHSEAET